MDAGFDPEVINQTEQAGPSTESIARQLVTQSTNVHKDQVEQYSRARCARETPEHYGDYV